MTMREKMARAHFQIGYGGYGPKGPPPGAWDKVDQDTRDAFLEVADVHLDAQMEPTASMISAGVEEVWNRCSDCETSSETASGVFKAMVGAAKAGK